MTHDGQANEAKIRSERLLDPTYFDGTMSRGYEVYDEECFETGVIACRSMAEVCSRLEGVEGSLQWFRAHVE